MMNDSLVSRQAVKDIMFNIRTNRYNNDKHFAELCLEEFDAIPSTQPEIKTDGDMISRQQTIDALMQEFKRIPTNSIRSKIVVENLPSAQPETNCSEIPNDSDTISRQAAIDAFEDTTFTKNEIRRRLSELPFAQPEIIHCKECKYGVQDEDKRWYCRSLGCQVGEADGSGFCADAERRTDD